MDKYRILALDGGGIRGLVTAILLKKLDRALPGVFDNVDLIAGNSSGGLIALAMAHGLGTPMSQTIGQICGAFEKGRDLFGHPTFWLTRWWLRSKYGTAHRRSQLQAWLRDPRTGQPSKLRDLEKKVLIPTFDLDNEGKDEERQATTRLWKPKLFHNFERVNGDGAAPDMRRDSDLETEAWRVALYTTAAPTYFPSVDGFVDGGVYANNPAMCALAQMFDSRYEAAPGRHRVDPRDVLLLSVGTGRVSRFIETQRFPAAGVRGWRNEIHWGALPWAWYYVDLTMEGTVGIADYQCKQMLGDERYHRIDPDLHDKYKLDEFAKIAELGTFVEGVEIGPTVDWLERHWLPKPVRIPLPPEATSKHLLGSAELTCLMPIKSGFVGEFETRTYTTRLRFAMKVLHGLRQASRHVSAVRVLPDIVDVIRSIHSFRLAIVHEKFLLLAVTFDRPWEPYIRAVWEGLGPLLDLLLINCVEYEAEASDKGFDRFSAWVRRHQIETGLFYTASPMTVDDGRYLTQFERMQREERSPLEFDRRAAGFVADDPVQEARRNAQMNPRAVVKQGLAVISALYGLRESYPDRAADGRQLPDGRYLRRAAKATLKDFDTERRFPPGHPVRTRFEHELAWFEAPLEGDAQLRPRPPEYKEMQGGILAAEKKPGVDRRPPRSTHGCLLLARIVNPRLARSFFRDTLIRTITPESECRDGGPRDGIYTNVAFTFRGLNRLGVSPIELARFPKEFREGMEERAGLLGDVRSNHPSNWSHPEWNWSPPGNGAVPRVRASTIDVVIQMRHAGAVEASVPEWTDAHPLYGPAQALFAGSQAAGLEVMSVQPMLHHLDDDHTIVDHFGFVDGISQPVPRSDRDPNNREWDNHVALGELFLGYHNDRRDPAFPDPEDKEALPGRVRGSLLDNGTFLVVRKLEQDVPALHACLDVFLKDQSQLEWNPSDLLAKMMGRAPDGTPLTTPVPADKNSFTYGTDPNGGQCPLHAHIRRGNPRDGRVPRIMRRGMSYGPRYPGEPDARERGLMFLAYNASIAEQFEVIQRWMTGANSTRGYSGCSDPFLRVPQQGESAVFRFVQDAEVLRLDLDRRGPAAASDNDSGPAPDPAPFVRLKWGMYLFVPSISALETIAKEPQPDARARDAQIALGERVMASLQRDDDWSSLLEDVTAVHSGRTAAVCAALRARGGVLRTPERGMILVASEPLIMRVLRDDKVFSVSQYRHRMVRSIGEIYLGLDHGDDYRRLSEIPNRLVSDISAAEAFEVAEIATNASLKRLPPNADGTITIPLDVFAEHVLASLSNYWFGIPNDQEIKGGGRPQPGSQTVHLPFNSFAPSRYIFSSPRPRPEVALGGQRHGAALRNAVRELAETKGPGAFQGDLAKGLWRMTTDDRGATDHDLFARLLVGLIEGFLPTVYGNFLKTLHLWIGDETLWRVQQDVLAGAPTMGSYEQAAAIIEPQLKRAMQARPVPEILYRTATTRHTLGGVTIERGERVVLLIASATQDLAGHGIVDDVYPVFGGNRREHGHPTHACPAYQMGMGVLLGMISGLLHAGTLEPAESPLAVRVVPPEGPADSPGVG
jgi:Dyp-type peroxidase family